jgi:tRNA A-37 threonylcarbamoyl transferase component Bud32
MPKAALLQDFGPFRILRQIAVGGMAEIYLARQRGLQGIERTVVVKRILERYADDAEFITMFLDEARLMAALSHPNIAQVFDVGQGEGTYYLVMEHVRGPTLGKLLSAAREKGMDGLPRREALGIGLMVAEALHYVHERRDELGRPLGIVHRDLNPANVIVSYDGAIKLIDFGIAKAATKVYETRTGVIKGTYGYIAPEALVGTRIVDRRADVFALGILLYEMCVGVHPYDVSDEPNLIDRILEARYRRPRDVRPDIPNDLDRTIASCLAPHPEGRPEDMAAVIEALAKHLGDQRMVPTQHAIAQLVRKLVPDAEGPGAMKPLTQPKIPRPFVDAPDGTRRVRIEEGTKPATKNPPDVWSEATHLRLNEPVLSPEDPLSLPLTGEHPLPTDDANPTQRNKGDPAGNVAHLHKKISEEDEELATTLMAMPPTPLPGEIPSLSPRIPPQEPTWVPKKTSPGAHGFSRLWLIPIGLAGVVFAGLVAFVVTLAIGGDEPAPRERETPPPEAPQAIDLRVVSEPAGALVSVDGRPAPGTTPLTVTVPPGSEVWLRLSKPGYQDQERRVSAAIGETRFVLRELTP